MFQIISLQTTAVVGQRKTLKSARRLVDKLDNTHGAYTHAIRELSDPKATVLEKLHPSNIRLSPKMRWLMDSLTGQDNGARGPRGEAPMMLQITSDGFVQAGSMFIGDARELMDNVEGVLDTVNATSDERIAFAAIIRRRVQDWRF